MFSPSTEIKYPNIVYNKNGIQTTHSVRNAFFPCDSNNETTKRINNSKNPAYNETGGKNTV